MHVIINLSRICWNEMQWRRRGYGVWAEWTSRESLRTREGNQRSPGSKKARDKHGRLNSIKVLTRKVYPIIYEVQQSKNPASQPTLPTVLRIAEHRAEFLHRRSPTRLHQPCTPQATPSPPLPERARLAQEGMQAPSQKLW